MGAAQKLTLKVLKAQCLALEERYPGYRVDVVMRLGAILKKVQKTATNLRDEVAKELQDFGDALDRKTTASDPSAEA